jgi:O-antigen ligase
MPRTASPALAPRLEVGLSTSRDLALGFYLVFVSCGGLGELIGVPAEASSSLASTVNQVVLIVLLVVALLAARADGLTFTDTLRGTLPFALVALLVAVSPLWSDVPDVAARRAVRMVLELWMLATLVCGYRAPRQAFQVVWYVVAVVACLDIASLALPQASFTDIGFRGVHNHKNEAGSFALLALPVAAAGVAVPGFARSRALAVLVLMAVLVVLVLSKSKTSAVLALLSVALAGLLLAVGRLTGRWLAVLSLAMVNGILLTGWLASARDVDVAAVLAQAGIDPTLTGRDEVWQVLLERWSERPLLGYGYGSFWDTAATSEEVMRSYGLTFAFGQGHNGYLDVLIQLGLAGLLAAGAMGVAVLVRLLSRMRDGGDCLVAGLAATVFVSFWLHNMTESTLLRVGSDMWVFFVVAMLLLARPVQPELRAKPLRASA